MSGYAGALQGAVSPDGKIDYETVLTRKDSVETILSRASRLDAESVHQRSNEDRKAFWYGIYHCLLLLTILDHYPPGKSPEGFLSRPGESLDALSRIPGFWTARTVRIAGTSYTLQSIEAEILWKIFPDPRWPFVLWRGSASGPGIPLELPGSVRFERYLERRAQEFFRQEGNYFRASREKVVVLSPLADWYRDQIFAAQPAALPRVQSRPLSAWNEPADENSSSILKAISPYLPQKERFAIEDGGYRIIWSHYDWRLLDGSATAHRAPQMFLESAPLVKSHAPEGTITMPVPADEQKRMMEMQPPKEVREKLDPDKQIPFRDPLAIPPSGAE